MATEKAADGGDGEVVEVVGGEERLGSRTPTPRRPSPDDFGRERGHGRFSSVQTVAACRPAADPYPHAADPVERLRVIRAVHRRPCLLLSTSPQMAQPASQMPCSSSFPSSSSSQHFSFSFSFSSFASFLSVDAGPSSFATVMALSI